MSDNAIIMLVVSAIILWGGLIISIVLLWRHPDRPEEPFTGPIYPSPPRWEPHRRR